jgi:hypothetical protein
LWDGLFSYIYSGYLTGPPSISVEKDTLDFGQIFLGVSDTMQLVVENKGSLDLLISNAVTQPVEYNVSPPFAGIDPGETEAFTVTFSPQLIGNYPGTLTLVSNDPLQGNYIVALSGEGVEPPVMMVSPDSLSMAIQPGQTGSRNLTIHNNGGSNLYFDIASGWSSQNYALQFDGVDDEVLMGYHSSLDILGNITICAWFKTETPQWGSLVSNFDQHGPDNGYELCIGSLYENGGFVYFECTKDDIRDGFSTNASFNDGQWHFVAATLAPNGTSRGKVFVDGIEQSGYNNPLGGPIPSIGPTPDYPFKLGAASNRTGPEGDANFDGIIDEVSIWDVSLTQAEIQAIMHSQLTGSEPGLVGYWQFNEAVGDTAFDRTANANHGTLQGGVIWTNSTAPIYPEWLSVTPDSGVCFPGTSKDIAVSFNAAELDTGNYFANLFITSNDPFLSQVTIPVHLWVSNIVDIHEDNNLPMVYSLHQNYPNPFNPGTTIEFALAKPGWVTLKVYNILGQEVAELISENLSAGSYKYHWETRGLASGVYYYRIDAGRFKQTKKLVLLR